MSYTRKCPLPLSRRHLLSGGFGIAGVGAASLLLSHRAAGRANAARFDRHNLNGDTDPYPIPWLDKFGSHNQAAGPNSEPSHIFHFKGRVVRCNNFVGMGTDNKGNRIAFGAPSTDYGIMQGEYWAARTTQQGSFVHI